VQQRTRTHSQRHLPARVQSAGFSGSYGYFNPGHLEEMNLSTGALLAAFLAT
jgi:hypothetical protein